jgi:hypothetical protein
MRSEISPLRQLGTLIAILEKLCRSSECVETVIALHGSEGCALKANRSLVDPIVKLKVDSPEI